MAEVKDAHSGHELGEPAVFGKAAMIVPRTSPSTKLIMRATDMAKTVQGSAPAMMLTTDTPGLVIELPRSPLKGIADVLKVLVPQRPARLNAVNCLYLRQDLLRGSSPPPGSSGPRGTPWRFRA